MGGITDCRKRLAERIFVIPVQASGSGGAPNINMFPSISPPRSAACSSAPQNRVLPASDSQCTERLICLITWPEICVSREHCHESAGVRSVASCKWCFCHHPTYCENMVHILSKALHKNKVPFPHAIAVVSKRSKCHLRIMQICGITL